MNEVPVVATEFDFSKLYQEEIEPLVLEIKRKCRVNKIPMFYSFAVKNNNDETEYKNDGVFPGSAERDLHDDNFVKYLMVLQGAELLMKENVDKSIEDELDDYMNDPGEDDDPFEYEEGILSETSNSAERIQTAGSDENNIPAKNTPKDGTFTFNHKNYISL